MAIDIQSTVKLIDSASGELVSYSPTTTNAQGQPISDDDVDNVIYRKAGSTYFRRNYTGPVNVRWFGMLPDYDPNDTTSGTDYTILLAKIFSLYKNIFIPKGNYKLSKYQRTNGLTCRGELDTNLYMFYKDTPAMVQFGDNNICSGINFYSTDPDLNNARAGVEQSTNVTLDKCGFYDFQNPTNINAWGLYFKNAKDCLINNCHFGNNSQSDLAIVDNCQNINIISPVNNTDTGGMFIDIEPNSTQINKGIIINGGVYRQINLLNNNNNVDASTDITIVGAQIDTLKYNGADALITQCTINTIINSINSVVFAGKLDCPMILSENLVKDPYFYDLDQTDTTRLSKIWAVSSSWKVNRVGNPYLDINYDNTTQSIGVTQGENIPVSSNTPYLVFFRGGAIYPSSTTNAGNVARVDYFDNTGTLLSSSSIRLFRGMAGTTVEIENQIGIVVPPANTASLRIIVGNFTTTASSSIQIEYIGLFRILSLVGGSSCMDYITRSIHNSSIYTVVKKPLLTTSPGSNVGDIIKLYEPTIDDNVMQICITAGKPGVFKPLDNNLTPAAAQPDTTATDVAGLASDFNALLAKLRTSGQLAT